MDSEMLKRAALAAKAEWAGFIDCPGEMYDSEAARISRAALLAALDPMDEEFVHEFARLRHDDDGSWYELGYEALGREIKEAQHCIAVLNRMAQGEQP